MKKEIIINSTLEETHIAITEDGKLAELFIEMPDQERTLGNIYLGRVNKIVQGINAAFIDIGMQQDAFLHFSDIDESMENFVTDEKDLEKDDDTDFDDFVSKDRSLKPVDDDPDSTNIALRKAKPNGDMNLKHLPTFKTKKLGQLQINLEPGQDVIVQVVREAYSSKGVRVTTKIAIPGRYTVLLPFDSIIGVSKRIGTFQERRRLRFLARTSLPEGQGCIIRTAAYGKNENELKRDFHRLREIWTDIENKLRSVKAPSLLYQDMQLATSVIRDLFTKEVKRVVVDSKKLHKEIISYLKWAAPNLIKSIELYNNKKPIFNEFEIEKELATTYQRKVHLPSGGSIVIEQTEAMIVVDVNSGRSISESQQENTALKTNLEALKEIARQIRLRDIAGLMIIDFIDMVKDKNRKKIYTEMKQEINRDRAKAVVYPLTQLCLMQITRQRINQNIQEKMSEPCPTCHGLGRIASKAVLINAIERWLKNFRNKSREFRLILMVHPHVAAYLTEGTISRISRLMIKYFTKIKIQQNEHIKIDQFRFISMRREKDITQEYL